MSRIAAQHLSPSAAPPAKLLDGPSALVTRLQLLSAELVRRAFVPGVPFRSFVVPVLAIAYAWETLEHYLEADSIPVVMDWMQGVEFWGNRLIADPLAVLTGALVQRAWGTPTSARAVRVCIAIWLVVHVFVFADCMVLQRQLPSYGALFGDKATAWLDLWTIDHFMSGMSIGAWLVNRRRLRPLEG